MSADIQNNAVNTSSAYYLSHILWKVFRFFLLSSMVFVILYPLLYMCSMAFRQVNDVLDPTIVWIPRNFTLENFAAVIDFTGYWKALTNTVFVSGVCSVLQLLVCSLTGYGLARFKFRGKGIFLAVILFSILIPPQMISMPVFVNFKDLDFLGILHFFTGSGSGLKLLDSPASQFMLSALGQGIRAGLFILIFYQIYLRIPAEIEEAAMVDGCGYFRTYIRIMLPNARNAILIVFLFSVVWYFNDYYIANIFMNNFFTVSTRLAGIRSAYALAMSSGNPIDPYQIVVMEQAACILTILPMLILYTFAQKHLIQGIERSGIVG